MDEPHIRDTLSQMVETAEKHERKMKELYRVNVIVGDAETGRKVGEVMSNLQGILGGSYRGLAGSVVAVRVHTGDGTCIHPLQGSPLGITHRKASTWEAFFSRVIFHGPPKAS